MKKVYIIVVVFLLFLGILYTLPEKKTNEKGTGIEEVWHPNGFIYRELPDSIRPDVDTYPKHKTKIE